MKPGKDEGIGSEQEEVEEETGQEVMQVKLKASDAEEEETWKLQMDGKSDRRRGAKKEQRRKRKGAEERDERRRGRKRRGRKHSDRVGKRRSSKDSRSEHFEEKRTSQVQEASPLKPVEEGEEQEQAAVVSASPSIELTNSCDLSDPIYVGCGGAGLYNSTLPGPLLFSSQSLVPIRPGPPPPAPPAPPALPPPPQLHGTKRPHSPALPCGLPQLGQQPLEVRPGHEHLTQYVLRSHCRQI